MMRTEELVAAVTEAVVRQIEQSRKIVGQQDLSMPVGVSNRHVHLSQEDLASLFGAGIQLTKRKDLSQPGQYACNQTVTLVGPRGVIEDVRILGPVRSRTQVEISVADGFRLGIKPPVRDSGDLDGSAKATLVGPEGSVTLQQGVIVAARHIHMQEEDAARFGVRDKDRVCVRVPGERGLIFEEVLVRVSRSYFLEFHVDLDEANASGLQNQDRISLWTPPRAGAL